MTTLVDLYTYYCRRCSCKPNSRLRDELGEAYERAGEQRVLRDIDVSGNYVGPKGFQPLVLLLANLDTIERFDASNNMLTHASLEALADIAVRHRGLREVALSNNAFHDSSAALLLHMLKTNWNITDLKVDGNDLTPTTLARIDEQLALNRQAVAKAIEASELLTAEQRAIAEQRERQRYTPWESVADCCVETHRSGGSLHFASWRDNPQYQLFTSHKCRVTITMTVSDPAPTRLCGFALLRGKDLKRVVDITSDPSVVIAESAFSDTSATVCVELDAAPRSSLKPYIVVPLTFQPRKAFQCTLKASIPSDLDGPLVKLEPLDPRGDWFVNRLDGEWVAGSAGGALTHPSWRRNPMYRLRYKGGPTKGKATLCFVLSKANDDDDNDERAIGLYVLAADAKGRRPIRAGAAFPHSVVAALDHRRVATQVFTVERPCDAEHLDLFVMPTTELPHQDGAFQLTLLSTCELAVDDVPFPLGWHHQRVRGGVWDSHRSGGCRADNPTTWTHNPCYVVDVAGDGPVDLHAQLEAKLDTSRSAPPAAGSSSRGGTPADIGVALVKIDDGLTPIAHSHWVPASACTWGDLWVTELNPGRYYLVPLTRVAGQLGTFEIDIVASRAVHVSLETPLSARLRQRQLERYEEETTARREQQRAQAAELTAGTEGSAVLDGTTPGTLPADLAAAAETRAEAMAAYHQTGQAFVDRSFPRGASSLWKNAMEQPVTGSHPNVHAWRRPDEIMAEPHVPRADEDLGVVPQGYDTAWVHSALAAVAARPTWLRNLIVCAQPQYGVYQVRFFKAGSWQTVTIDDYLPVDAAGELCFARPLTAGSLLAPLVEKAYAKLHRCYEALDAETSATQAGELDAAAKRDATSSDTCDAGVGLVSRALGDFTGGVVTERRLYDAPGRQWVLKGFWAHLQTCRDESRVIALRLTEATPRSFEKKESGIMLDRLYPVVDTRDVEGVKLVKLRNYWGWGTQDAGAAKEWGGKWRVGSELWTTTLRKAVALQEDDRTTFWVSAEEAAFYFGVVHTVDRAQHRAWAHGAFACNAPGGDLQSPHWPQNPQYALRVEAEEPVDVLIGIHQPDSLLTLTRDDTARVAYRAALGVTTVRTTDDRRKLLALTDKEVPYNGPTASQQRDAFYRVRVDPRCSYIVMPHNATPIVEAPYSISASCARPVTLSWIGSDLSVSVDGEWTAETAGGPPTAPTWRNNPQYLVYATEETTATFMLRQRNELASTTDAIGLHVIAARDVRRAMNFGDCDVIAVAKHDNAHTVSVNVRLQATKDRLGMPYLVVPSTSKPEAVTGFTLEVACNAHVTVKPIDPDVDFRRRVVTGRMAFEDGNAGGSVAHSSWRCNPQYAVSFPVQRTGRLVVSLSKRVPSDVQEIGLYALRADEWDHGRRRKVHLKEPRRDILAQAPPTTGTATDVTVDFSDQRAPIIVMPCTTAPFSECEYQLSFYCTCEFTVRPVDEWETHDVSASWELGTTAGGCKENHKSWINNPFAALNVTRPTRVTIVALQYPRGPEKPIVRRVGKQRVLVPPPIVNDRSKVCFGFDIATSNGEAEAMRRYTLVHSTKHTFEAEAVHTVRLDACDAEPYYIVPHTYDAEQEADFRVFIYADQPVQFFMVEKPRVTYV